MSALPETVLQFGSGKFLRGFADLFLHQANAAGQCVGRVAGPEEFARQTLERFRNPFLDHKFSDILTYHAQKVAIRLVPTRDEFRAQFGREPPLLSEAIAWSESSS
jgi:tagaturonate reductase